MAHEPVARAQGVARSTGGQELEIRPPENLKDIEKLMVAAAKNKASDLHLKVGQKPILRVSTVVHELGKTSLSKGDVHRMVYEILTDVQKSRFEKEHDVDFAYSLEGVGRFRVNIFHDRGNVALAARRVNTSIPSLAQLNLPQALERIVEFEQGLIMVSGPTGSGKSTTLACLIDSINTYDKAHIITIEDPIEFLFQDKKSFINQREIGIDVENFHRALKTVVRQDPDVILVGEMRDAESFDAALMAAETGHLVFSTIHASSAPQTITRLAGRALQKIQSEIADRQILIKQLIEEVEALQPVEQELREYHASLMSMHLTAEREAMQKAETEEAEKEREKRHRRIR